ncbi:hypothetical protein F2Q70_00035832 [Brassica cretica]|uniref:Uncharacterized protein n=1 Tax=Brassica cretica TaxID=69181 RepID=A0A8S9JPN4_BRACR|nr:hypothetical protein F2Q68_00031057 [Brassica cretica]KAF2583709.1 hypothetical protein F2Q70_00035832 [Brassica cretica]
MDPNHARSDCIESINLDISRSGKPKPSKIDHDVKGQSIPLQRRGRLSSDKQSDTSRQATNKPDVAPSEEIMREILVDSGSAVNVASQKTLRSISQPTPVIDHEPTPLNSFKGKLVRSLGIVPLTTRTHDVELQTRFTIVDHFMPFDAIIGRPWLQKKKGGPIGLPPMLEVFITGRRKNHTWEPKTILSLLYDWIPEDAPARRERLTRP